MKMKTAGVERLSDKMSKVIVTDANVLAAVTGMLEARISSMGERGLAKLEAQCSHEGRERLSTNPQHQEGTTERWTWHAGYVSAMNDTLNMIKNRVDSFPIEDDA
jgi:hypothetical protein